MIIQVRGFRGCHPDQVSVWTEGSCHALSKSLVGHPREPFILFASEVPGLRGPVVPLTPTGDHRYPFGRVCLAEHLIGGNDWPPNEPLNGLLLTGGIDLVPWVPPAPESAIIPHFFYLIFLRSVTSSRPSSATGTPGAPRPCWRSCTRCRSRAGRTSRSRRPWSPSTRSPPAGSAGGSGCSRGCKPSPCRGTAPAAGPSPWGRTAALLRWSSYTFLPDLGRSTSSSGVALQGALQGRWKEGEIKVVYGVASGCEDRIGFWEVMIRGGSENRGAGRRRSEKRIRGVTWWGVRRGSPRSATPGHPSGSAGIRNRPGPGPRSVCRGPSPPPDCRTAGSTGRSAGCWPGPRRGWTPDAAGSSFRSGRCPRTPPSGGFRPASGWACSPVRDEFSRVPWCFDQR